MTTFLFTFGVLILVMLGMALGVIIQNKPIKGSCGGMASLGVDTACDICGGDTRKCEEEQLRLGYDGPSGELDSSSNSAQNLSYDASEKS